MFEIRAMLPGESIEVAHLIHRSTNHWYETHHHSPAFPGEPHDCLIFPETYEALDPGHCLVAIEPTSGKIIGSCFHHPRPTHHSLGIMNAHPNHRGGAKALLRHLVNLAQLDGKPLRLVSSAGNLDSFSLYNRQGFIPYAVFQDITIEVPAKGFPITRDAPPTRAATPADLPAIVQLEESLAGISRAKDWQHFIENRNGHWSTLVTLNPHNEPTGAIAAIKHPAIHQIGPAIAPDPATLLTLITSQLNHSPGDSPLILVPADQPALTGPLYEMGARNHELHLAQSLGPAPVLKGLTIPTFLPETA